MLADIVLYSYGSALLSFSLLVAALRFTAVGLSAGDIAIIIITQVMHMVTFGLHHSAVMKYLD